MKLLILAHLVITTALLSRLAAYGSASAYTSSTPVSKLKFTGAPQKQKSQEPSPSGTPKPSL